MIETRSLVAFLALAEELHFGRTAERLGLAASVLSSRISRIEDLTGAKLFERGRRSAVSLTLAGRMFRDEALAAARQIERAEMIARMAGRGEAGPARIGFVTSAALTGCLTAVLQGVRTRLPDLDIQAEPMDTPEQIGAVAEGRLDLGLIRPRTSYPDGVMSEVVHSEGLMVAVAVDHRLAAELELDAAALAGESFIFPQFSEPDGFSSSMDRLARSGLFEVGSSLRTKDFVSAVALAAAGYGVALAPASVSHLQLAGVRYLRISDHRDQVELVAIWRREGNARLVEAAVEELKSMSTAE